MLRREPARLRAHLEHADAGRIVDEQLRVAEHANRVRQPLVVPLPIAPVISRCASMRATDVSSRMNNCSRDISRLKKPTVRPSFMRACSAMFSTRLVFPIDGRAAMITRSPAWSPRVIWSRSVKPVPMPVMSFFVLEQLFDLRQRLLDDVAHRQEADAGAVFGDREDRLLRLVEDDVRVVFRLVGAGVICASAEDQRAQRRLLLDDARVVLDVGRARYAVHERREIGRAADLVELARAPELLFERDQVDRVSALAEPLHLVEDAPVRIAEEVARRDQLRGVVERFVVDQDRAEDRLLGLEVVRQRAFGGGDFGHGD